LGKKQHSIVPRLLRALRKSADRDLLPGAEGYDNVVQPPDVAALSLLVVLRR
jgi:hypothetical protein